ncbi:MAG: hypothetical protein IJQ18_08590 [Paludibacteraceae bacterium]|nr:hypothetical protein [Paludibacteraceae bacterium]
MNPNNSCSPLEASLDWCEGKPVLPGLRRRIYYTHKSNITKWPTLPKDALGRPTSSVLQGSFELKADVYWKHIDMNVNNSGVTSDPQGESPSQTQLNKLSAVHPGVDEEASMLPAYVNNSDVVYLVQTANGKYRLIGNEMYQSKSTAKQDLGQGPTGTASTTLEVECTDQIAAPFYEGEIVISATETINPQGSGSGSGSDN